jgi:hypothetical protein
VIGVRETKSTCMLGGEATLLDGCLFGDIYIWSGHTVAVKQVDGVRKMILYVHDLIGDSLTTDVGALYSA